MPVHLSLNTILDRRVASAYSITSPRDFVVCGSSKQPREGAGSLVRLASFTAFRGIRRQRRASLTISFM